MEANQLSAKDLKIGNYVNYFGIYLPVYSIIFPQPMEDERFSGKWIVEIFDGASTTHCVIDDLEPIPLSEDVLLKLGFENSYRSDYTITMHHKTNDKFGIKINNATGISLVYLGIPIRVEYIHQLQNLYHALTGEELTFKK